MPLVGSFSQHIGFADAADDPGTKKVAFVEFIENKNDMYSHKR